VQAEDGAAVVEQIELDTAAAARELFVALIRQTGQGSLGRCMILSTTQLADFRRIHSSAEY
jgi:hypothetical protein